MKSVAARLISWLFELPRPHKRLVSVAADVCFIILALWGSFALRLENWFWVPSTTAILVFSLTAITTIIIFIRLGLYRAVIRYISEKALMVIMIGVVCSSVALVLAGFVLQAGIPRSVPVIYCALLFLLVAGTRFLFRSIINRPQEKLKGRVLIVGIGRRALQLHYALMQGTEYRPMGFVALDCGRHTSFIAGFQVYSVAQVGKVVKEQGVQRVFLALEDGGKISRKQLMMVLEELRVPVQTVPSMSALLAKQARINEVRDLDIEDLLGRDPVLHDPALTATSITGKVIMVTGAGGSIGSELCRQIIRNRPACVVLMEQSEYALYSIERELLAINESQSTKVAVHALLGSVIHRRRCENIMRSFGVQVVYHAAAYKHVPLVEHNAIEGVQNNVMGTWHCAEAAISAGVEQFVLISTDKAVRPTNVMGASKRMAELVLQALAERQQSTMFSMVRFGNVLGSSGSVVPLFREQIRAGGPVTVTHPDITRYFMTIPEASQLVLQAAAMSNGGEVFVLNMGEPVKIADLARKMIHLMGLSQKTAENPVGDVPVVYVGLRPGEKLYEELLIGNNPQPTLHPRILMAREESLSWPRLEVLLTALASASQGFDCQKVVDILGKAPTGYSPNGQIEDTLWSCISDNAGQRGPGFAVPRNNTRIASPNVYKFPV